MIYLLVIGVFSSGVVFASGINGYYKGYPVAEVKLNGIKLAADVPAIILDSRTLLPVRAVAEAVNSVVSWDQKTMTAKIIKPAVNMIFAGSIKDDENGLILEGAGSYFNTTGTGRWENLYVEIGPMDSRIYEYRVAVFDPNGKMIGASDAVSNQIGKDGLIALIPVKNLTYSVPGNYKFKFQVKYDGKFENLGETVAVVK